MTPLILIGAGGHAAACIDVIHLLGAYSIEALVDTPENMDKCAFTYKVAYTDNDLPMLIKKYENVLITLGQIKTPNIRQKIYQHCKSLGASFPFIISPLAYVSPLAHVEGGSIIMHHALVNAGAQVKSNCIINTKALIEHGTSIGSHSHIATGAIINGDAKIEDGCFVGSGAVVGQGVTIGANSIIGAASLVLKNVPPATTVKGVW